LLHAEWFPQAAGDFDGNFVLVLQDEFCAISAEFGGVQVENVVGKLNDLTIAGRGSHGA
jgi:hypothetical protein